MKLYVLTSDFETVAVMDNTLDSALHYFDDEFHRYLENGASTFDLSVVKPFKRYGNATDGTEDDYQYLVENNYLVFTYQDKDYMFNIRRVEETEMSMRVYCQNLSLDLLNEYRAPYTADKQYKLAKYVEDCLYDSGYEIGINEFSSNVRTLKWEGDQTVLARILSIANSFNAEVEFETVLNADRTIGKNLVHFRKRVGVDRPDIELKYGKDVSSIRRTVDIDDLVTGLKVRGHEEDGKTTTIKNVVKSEKNSDGVEEFYTRKGSEYVLAPLATQQYGRKNASGGGHIIGQYEYDTKSDTELYNRALTELKKRCVPSYEYEIEGYYDVNIGDTIRAIDEAYNPILILEARVSEQIISFSDPSKNQTKYSNYKVLENKVSQSLLDRVNQLAQMAKILQYGIDFEGSPVFKNGEGTLKLYAHVDRNNVEVTDEFTEYNWTKKNADGTVDEAWTKAHQDFGKIVTVTSDDIDGTAVFSFTVEINGEQAGNATITVSEVYDGEQGEPGVDGIQGPEGEQGIPGKDGKDGKTQYTHIAYANSIDGKLDFSASDSAREYIGMYVDFTVNDSTNPEDYAWTKVKGQDGTQGTPGKPGSDGKTPYFHTAWANSADGKTEFSTTVSTDKQYLGTYTDYTSADSNDPTKYAWSKIKGDTGADGRTPYTHWAYAWSADGTDRFTTVYPNENLWLGEREYYWESATAGWSEYTGIRPTDNGTKFTDATFVTPSFWIKTTEKLSTKVIAQVIFSKNGVRQYVYNIYVPISDAISGEMVKRTINITEYSSEINKVSIAVLKPTEIVGEEFRISDIKIELGENLDPIYTPAPSEDYANAYPTYIGTYTDYTADDSTDPTKYTWARVLGEAGQDGKDGIAGKDGVGIKSTQIMYAQSTSGTTAPTTGWTAQVPTLIKGQYLWTQTTWVYTDNTGEAGYTVSYNAKDGNSGDDGLPGKDGVGIKATNIEYVGSTSGTVKPTTGWTTVIPTVAAGSFLWTRTTLTYTDNTTEQVFSVAKMGDTGATGPKGNDGANGVAGKDGKGIKATAITYQASTNGTTAPTGTWSANVPTVAKGSFLWTRTIWTYTDNSTETGYSVAYVAKDGKDGSDGKPGQSATEVISGYLTNEAMLVPANPQGAVSSYDNATGQFVVTEGNKTISTGITFAVKSTVSCTASIDNKGNYKVTAMTADLGTIFLTAKYKDITVEKVAIITKAKQGATGNTGSPGKDGKDGEKGATGAPGKDGTNGKDGATGPKGDPTGITVSSTAPSNPYTNQLWKNTGTSGGRIKDATYRYNGSSWELYTFAASNIIADTLSAIKANLGDVYGGSYTSEFDRPLFDGSTGSRKGKVLLKDGRYQLSYTNIDSRPGSPSAGNIGRTQIDELGIQMHLNKSNGNVINATQYNSDGILMNDASLNQYGTVYLRYQDLMSLPARIITNTASGFEPYATQIGSTSTPTAERKMRQVQLSGAFRVTKAFNISDTETVMATLPVGYRPSSIVVALCKGSGKWYHMLTVWPDGTIRTSRYNRDDGQGYVVNSWLKIDITFVAGDI